MILIFINNLTYIIGVNNIVRNIIYSADNSVVKMTMIDGKILYEDGQYKTIDLDEVIRECTKFKKDLA